VTPEESAAWFAAHKSDFTLLDIVRCPHCAKGRVLTAAYAYRDGRRPLWIAPRQQTDHDGVTVKRPARAVDPDDGRQHVELLECGRCRHGLVLLVDHGEVAVRPLGPPTRLLIGESPRET
jgi:uncharacterized protein YbaR (Trm112 family)